VAALIFNRRLAKSDVTARHQLRVRIDYAVVI